MQFSTGYQGASWIAKNACPSLKRQPKAQMQSATHRTLPHPTLARGLARIMQADCTIHPKEEKIEVVPDPHSRAPAPSFQCLP